MYECYHLSACHVQRIVSSVSPQPSLLLKELTVGSEVLLSSGLLCGTSATGPTLLGGR